ncbi:3745_t:CDS:1, partial [Entrophospora sp. SA101]
EHKKVGDGTCFQSCLDFIRMLYFPKSGDLQVFGVIDEDYRSGEIAVQTFNNHLKEFIDLPSLGPA